MMYSLICVCAALLLYPAPSSQQCPSTGGNAVELKFYRAQSAQFTSENGELEVAVEVLAEANIFCAADDTQCDLLGGYNTTNQFKDLHVVTEAGYPKNKEKDMLHKIHLVDPENTTCAIKKEFLIDIIENARDDIYEATGYWITYIDSEFFGIPPPTRLNQIIIPIAFGILLILILLTIILYKLHERREAAERRERILRDRKKKSQKSPAKPYVSDTSDPKAVHTTPSVARVKRKRKDELYKDNVRKSNLSKQTASIASEDSAIKLDTMDTTRHRHGYAYENRGATGHDGDEELQERTQYNHLKPIDRTMGDDVEKKKKKKKKKSKSKDQEQLETEVNGAYQEYVDEED